MRLHVGGDEIGRLALVKAGGAPVGDALQRAREIGKPQDLARLVRLPLLRELSERGG